MGTWPRDKLCLSEGNVSSDCLQRSLRQKLTRKKKNPEQAADEGGQWGGCSGKTPENFAHSVLRTWPVVTARKHPFDKMKRINLGASWTSWILSFKKQQKTKALYQEGSFFARSDASCFQPKIIIHGRFHFSMSYTTHPFTFFLSYASNKNHGLCKGGRKSKSSLFKCCLVADMKRWQAATKRCLQDYWAFVW